MNFRFECFAETHQDFDCLSKQRMTLERKLLSWQIERAVCLEKQELRPGVS